MIATVVLAAGAASRFGSAKQVLLLPAVLERLQRSPVDDIVVVEGAHPLDSLDLSGVRVVKCPDWQIGPGASLRCGLAALDESVEGAIIVLADGPDLDPRTIERVLEHRRDGDIIAATYGGVRDHPVYLSREAFRHIPDAGMRDFRAFAVPCDDLTAPGDVDTPNDLEGLW